MVDFKMWQLQNRPSLTEQITRWLELQSKDPQTWSSCSFEAQKIQLLLRNRTNDIPEECLVIASFFLPEELQRQGIFKSFINYLTEISPWKTIVIEDVSNENLVRFCEKYKFKAVSPMYETSY